MGLYTPLYLCLLGLLLCVGARAAASELTVISSGKVVEITAYRVPERPTLFVFYKPASTLERSFLERLQQGAGDKVGLRAIQLKTGSEAIATQYQILETPTAMVYDRRGRLVARSAVPEEIEAALTKAAGTPRMDWAEEGDANYKECVRLMGRAPGAGILRTMSLQPEYLKYIHDLSMKAHFSDGYLPRRVKEMIAAYVSELNRCKY